FENSEFHGVLTFVPSATCGQGPGAAKLHIHLTNTQRSNWFPVAAVARKGADRLHGTICQALVLCLW
ncbi:MAG: hypothetical protein Q8Q63_11465, partial [Phaeovulum sp.]|uniref:hypothetical protein n=1 Tax=Phaeovulum sp. TaxID=2934796 RepID=UPI002733D06B